MIKMGGTTKSGRKFVLLGLSELNLTRLREKKPIVVFGTEIRVPEIETLVICWGETEDDLTKELSRMIDENTRVIDRRGEKKN
jgi:hypothetical protein